MGGTVLFGEGLGKLKRKTIFSHWGLGGYENHPYLFCAGVSGDVVAVFAQLVPILSDLLSVHD